MNMVDVMGSVRFATHRANIGEGPNSLLALASRVRGERAHRPSGLRPVLSAGLVDIDRLPAVNRPFHGRI